MVCCWLAAAALAWCAPSSGASHPARVLAEKFLTAVGGRDVWAAARYVHTTAVNHHPDARLPYIQEGWIDLRALRHRIELTNFDMQRARAYTAERGWGIAEQSHYRFTPERLAEAHDTYRFLIYRKLYLLAIADPELRVALDGERRLAFRHAGADIGWVDVDPNTGAPVAAGTSDGELTRFGALAAFGPVRWVTSGESTSGWGFETLAFELLDDGAAVEFEPPAGFRPTD